MFQIVGNHLYILLSMLLTIRTMLMFPIVRKILQIYLVDVFDHKINFHVPDCKNNIDVHDSKNTLTL